MMLGLHIAPTFAAELAQKLFAIIYVVNPSSEPSNVPSIGARCAMILVIKLVIPIIVSLHRRWMRAARLVDDGADLETWDENAVRVAHDHRPRHDSFRNEDDPLTCQAGFFADAKIAQACALPSVSER